MEYHLQRLSGPAVEPVSLDEAKEQCRIRHSAADARLTRLIRSAREQAEGQTRRALIRQVWEQTQRVTGPRLLLQRWPVLQVTAVAVDGAPLAAGSFSARLGDGAYVDVPGVACGAEVVVTFEAGYGDAAADVPESLRDWMLVKIADAYNNPGSVVIGTINSRLDFIDGLLAPFQVPR